MTNTTDLNDTLMYFLHYTKYESPTLYIQIQIYNTVQKILFYENTTTNISLNIKTDRQEQTVKTQIIRLLKELSDQGLHVLSFQH